MLDGSESQYSGMQIGTLQDEEEEGVAPAPEEAPESFAHSVLGTKQIHVAPTFMQYTHAGYSFFFLSIQTMQPIHCKSNLILFGSLHSLYLFVYLSI